MKPKSTSTWVAWIFVIVGALTWGLYGIASFNILEAIFGIGWLARILYFLVGVSAVYLIYEAFFKKD